MKDKLMIISGGGEEGRSIRVEDEKKSHMWNFWKLESTIEFMESFINKERRKPMSSVLFIILLRDYTCAVKCVHLKCTA